MDDVFERKLVECRADTSTFERDVDQMRDMLDIKLVRAAEHAGQSIEAALLRAVRTGKLSFDDLRTLAFKVLDDIAAAALRAGIDAMSGGTGGLGGVLGGILTGVLGAPGRATGGPVVGGRAYTVGERGPELFVPQGAGRIEPLAGGGAREVRVAITINAGRGEAATVLAQSSRQVARAVKAALEG